MSLIILGLRFASNFQLFLKLDQVSLHLMVKEILYFEIFDTEKQFWFLFL